MATTKVSIPLTPQRLRFVQEYLKEPNGAHAARLAGYAHGSAKVTAARLLTDANVKQAIADGMGKAARATGLSVQWVLDMLQENAKRSMQAIPVLDKLGHPTGEYRWEPQAANTALQLLGKHLRLFPDGKEVSGPHGGPIETETKAVVIHVSPATAREALAALQLGGVLGDVVELRENGNGAMPSDEDEGDSS